jgi:hypothetical protein
VARSPAAIVTFPAPATSKSQVGRTQVPFIAPGALCITIAQSLLLRADKVIE